MFKPLIDQSSERVSVLVNSTAVRVPRSFTAAAAVLSVELTATRKTPVSGAPRAPYCMMGVCFECLMQIDGISNQQGCLVPVAEGMRIDFQDGARAVTN